MWILLLKEGAVTIGAVWVYSSVILMLAKDFGKLKKVQFVRSLWNEIKPFYLPAVIIKAGIISFQGDMLGWNTLWTALDLVMWPVLKDLDNDDRWKKRKAKLLARIERAGARLVVVPTK